jgi:hypothetical protein
MICESLLSTSLANNSSWDFTNMIIHHEKEYLLVGKRGTRIARIVITTLKHKRSRFCVTQVHL